MKLCFICGIKFIKILYFIFITFCFLMSRLHNENFKWLKHSYSLSAKWMIFKLINRLDAFVTHFSFLRNCKLIYSYQYLIKIPKQQKKNRYIRIYFGTIITFNSDRMKIYDFYVLLLRFLLYFFFTFIPTHNIVFNSNNNNNNNRNKKNINNNMLLYW